MSFGLTPNKNLDAYKSTEWRTTVQRNGTKNGRALYRTPPSVSVNVRVRRAKLRKR